MRTRHGAPCCEAGQATYPKGCEWHPEHFWCRTCAGWYGVPHDGIHEGRDAHPRDFGQAKQCACRPCKQYTGRES